jgi:phenolic acid decarboxylase
MIMGSKKTVESLRNLIGKHFIYTYENGWRYEIYVKNANTFSYRIHSGIVGGRWVTDQEASIVRLANNVFKISWDEPTGTSVSIAINLKERKLHGVIFFPRWIVNSPFKTICYQNEHLEEMRGYRDAGPTYPKMVVDEFAAISFIEECGPDRDDIICCPPSRLPDGYAKRFN